MRKRTDSVLPEIMTKQQVAEYLSVSAKTIERMMIDGLGSLKLRGKRYFTSKNIADYIERNQD